MAAAAVGTGVALAISARYLLQPAGGLAAAAAAAPAEAPRAAENPGGGVTSPRAAPAGGGDVDLIGLSRTRRRNCTCMFDSMVMAALLAGVVWVLRRDFGFDVRGALAAVERVFSTEAAVLKRLFL